MGRKINKKLAVLGLSCALVFGSTVPAAEASVAEAKSALEKKTEKIVNKQSNSEASTEENLKNLFQYVEKNYSYKRVIGFKASKGWEKAYAKEMISSKKGSCYHYAALYAFLAKKASGYKVRICIGKTNGFNKSIWQPHAWCEVKIKGAWYVCDANLDKYAAGSKGKYFMKKFKSVKKNYKRSKTVTVKF